MKTTIDLESYSNRICSEICGYHKLFRNMGEFKDYPVNYKWQFLAEHKCMTDCAATEMMQLLREERNQHMELEIDVDYVK